MMVFSGCMIIALYCSTATSKYSISSMSSTLLFGNYHGGGGSSIVKVPADVPPTSVYFLAILVEFSLGKGMLFCNFGQRAVKVR